MGKVLISVIIPVYNAEKTIEKCIDSVLLQSFRNFELILIDDGCQDSSPQICDEYAKHDSRVIVIHQQNCGVSRARNAGLNIAKGEWITFIDSDDYITQGYFEEVLESHEDILIHGYERRWMDGKIEYTLSSESFDLQYNISLFIANNFSNHMLLRGPVFKFYKKKKIARLKFPEDMKIGEDTCFLWNYLSICSSYKILHQGLYSILNPQQCDEIKYAIPLEKASICLNHLLDAFQKLNKAHHVNPSFFYSYILYYKRISSSKLWGSNRVIRKCYKYVWPYLTLRQKIRSLKDLIKL